MRIFLPLLALLLPAAGTAQVVINEFDVENPGLDPAEFIELYGPAGYALDGMCIVLYNGLNDLSYRTFALDGYALDAAGYFVVGGPQVAAAGLVVPEGNFLQPGTDAIALYATPASAYPVGSPLLSEDLLDAVVYGTNSPLDAILLNILTPGAVQVNESAGGLPNFHANARIPNGGAAFATETFVQQAPTPGMSNVLMCDGGEIESANPNLETVCTDATLVQLDFIHTTTVPGAFSTLVVVDAATDAIVATYAAMTANVAGLGDGMFEAWAVSHENPLDPASLVPGAPLSGISGTGCVSLSYTSVQFLGVTCEAPACDGGVLTDAAGTPEINGCLGFENAVIPFGYTSEAVEAEYRFVVASPAGAIVAVTDAPFFDFNTLGTTGTWHVWGVSALGGFVEASLLPGAAVVDIAGVECDSLSSTFLEVNISDCPSGSFCTEIFISEYLEGNSNNKALELYNPTAVAVDLSEYTVETWNNGATAPTNVQELSGMLMPGEVFVLANSQADPYLLQISDITSQATWYNGNDVIRLLHGDVVVDQMGEIGPDPGDSFQVAGGEGAMSENTLVRKANVNTGTDDWSVGTNQWDVYPPDTFDFIGWHTASCDGFPPMQIGFAAPELFVSEGAGVTVAVQVAFPLADAQVHVEVIGGDASWGADYPPVFPIELNFPTGLLNDQSFVFAAIDDEEAELQEDVVLGIQVVSGDVVIAIGEVTVHILPSDLMYPVYDIAQVRSVHPATGISDSLNVACELRGIVHGWNDYPAAFQFTLIDATGGINVFSPVSDFGYTDVVAGDSVRIRGVIGQFAGLTQIIADTLIFEGAGFATQEPAFTQVLDESTESKVVYLKCVELVNPAQWTNQPPSFDVDITTGMNQYRMRIDANTDLFGLPAPVGVFGVTGIADQRDFDQPYFAGYRISPRNSDDLTEPVRAAFTVESPWNSADGPIPLENLSTGAGSFFWSFGNGANSQLETPDYTYPTSGTFTITLTASSTDGNCSDQAVTTVDVVVTGVEELDLDFGLSPNPASDRLAFTCAVPVTGLELCDATGRSVAECAFPSGIASGTIDVSFLPAGLYTVRYTTASGTGAARVLVGR